MIVDTTTSVSNYTNNLKEIYFKNYKTLRKDFCKWIDKNGLIDNLDWWISNPASRNYNHSKLFHSFCLIESLKEFLPKNEISCVFVNDKNIRDVLKNQLKIKVNISIKNNQNSSIKNFFAIFKNFFYFSIVYFLSNLGKKKEIDKNLNLVLIDTFLEDSNLSNNRFYGNKLFSLVLKKRNIFFIPTFYEGMNLIDTIQKIINCKKNKKFLLKENYLSLKDLFWSFSLVFRKSEFKNSFTKLKSIDYTNFINEELRLNNNLSGQILAWQNFLFFKNLKKKNFKLSKSINWFENQPQDKGWNKGVRNYFPKAKSYGYQGFTYFPQYMCLSPTQREYSSKVVPEIVLSIGKKFNNSKKEFCKSLKVKTSPALNFQHLHKKQKKYFGKSESTLIILSGFIEDDVNLLNWVIQSNIHKENRKIFIKEHPILKIKKIKKFINFFPSNYKISKKDFWSSVNMSENLICSGSTSATIELIISGRFCIIPKINPLDEEIFKKLKMSKNFIILKRSNELPNHLKKNKIINYNKQNYFMKITKNNIKLFL